MEKRSQVGLVLAAALLAAAPPARAGVSVTTSGNQALMVGELDAEGAIRSLGVHATVTPDDVLRMLTRVLADFNVFAARVASKPIFDHLGARRVASAMLEHVT